MTIDELINGLIELKANGVSGDMVVLIDDGMNLREIEEVDLGSEDEGLIIWPGDPVEQ